MSVKSIATTYCPPFLRPALGRVQASPLATRVARGAFWSLAGAVVSRALGLAAFVVVARILGKAEYGRFGIIQSTVGMFGMFAGFGLGQTATKYVAELREKAPDRAGRIMAMAGLVAMVTGTLMAGALFVVAPWLASQTLAAPELAPLLRVGALILIVEAMNGAQTGALAGFEAFKTTAKINMWAGLASFPMMTLGVYWGGLTGCVWAYAANRTLNWLLNHLALRREARRAGVPFILRGSRAELSILWRYSLPSMLSGVMVSPTIWVCNAMLVNQPGGYDQMGIFQATSTFQQILFFLGNTLSAPLLPLLANRIGRENARLDRVNMLSTWALGALPAVVLFGLPEMATMLFGRGFAGSQFTYTFLLMIFCSSVVIYKQGLARILAAYGLMWWGMLSNCVWAINLVGCTYALASHGAVGYSMAWVLAYVLNTVLFIPLYLYKKLVPRGTIVSIEAGMIWLLLLATMALSFLGVPLCGRLLLLPVALGATVWSFWRLLKQGNAREKAA